MISLPLGVGVVSQLLRPVLVVGLFVGAGTSPAGEAARQRPGVPSFSVLQTPHYRLHYDPGFAADAKKVQGYLDRGIAPKVNAAKPAGEWNVLDVVWKSPRLDAKGEKTATRKAASGPAK